MTVTTVATERVVDTEGGELLIRFPYDVALRDDLKVALQWRRWDKERRTWVVPARLKPDVLIFAERHGFHVTDAAQSLDPNSRRASRPEGAVTIEGPTLVIRFGYAPELVQEVRGIMGRRWNVERKAWTAPITSIRAVLAFADRHGLDTTAITSLPDYEPVTEPTIVLKGSHFEITFPYDRDLHSRLQDTPTAAWDGRTWRVDLVAAIDVADLIHGRTALVDDGAAHAIAEARAALEQIEASRAADAELVIPTLNGELMPFQRAGVAYALRALGYVQDGATWRRTSETEAVPDRSGTV